MNMDIGFSAVKLFPKEALSKGKSKKWCIYTLLSFKISNAVYLNILRRSDQMRKLISLCATSFHMAKHKNICELFSFKRANLAAHGFSIVARSLVPFLAIMVSAVGFMVWWSEFDQLKYFLKTYVRLYLDSEYFQPISRLKVKASLNNEKFKIMKFVMPHHKYICSEDKGLWFNFSWTYINFTSCPVVFCCLWPFFCWSSSKTTIRNPCEKKLYLKYGRNQWKCIPESLLF